MRLLSARLGGEGGRGGCCFDPDFLAVAPSVVSDALADALADALDFGAGGGGAPADTRDERKLAANAALRSAFVPAPADDEATGYAEVPEDDASLGRISGA